MRPRARVLAGDVFDVDGEEAKFPFNLDVVTVAFEPRHGHYPDLGPVGADTGQTHRRRHVQVCWKALTGLASAS